MEYIGFVYLWKNLINGKKYIGSHVGKVDDGYIGSGKYFKNAIKKYGVENFERQILWFEINSIERLHQKEFELINEHNAVFNSDYYNAANLTPKQLKYISGIPQYADSFTQKGQKYYNNGIKDKRFIPGTQPEGWTKGRLSANVPSPGKGLKWYTTGKIDKRFIPGTQPEGWTKGRSKGIMKGSANPFYGKKHSKETIEKIKEGIRRHKCK